MDYFKTIPLRKWTKEKMQEYFANKDIILPITQLHSGLIFSTTRLATLCRIYGTIIGEKMYLIIRARMEREDDLIYKKNNKSSPITPLTGFSNHNAQEILSMSDLDLGSPLIQPLSQSPVERSVQLQPIFTSKNIDTQYERTIKENREYIKDYDSKIFINKYPPLLWQKCHIQYLLKSMNLPIEFNIDVDDFIFLTLEELENLYPNFGSQLYIFIKSKFINPNTEKIPVLQTAKNL